MKTAKVISTTVLQDIGLAPSRYLNQCIRWCRQAIVDIGVVPEANLKECRIDITGKMYHIRKPDDFHSLHKLDLITNDNKKQETLVTGPGTSPEMNNIATPENKNQATGWGIPQLREDVDKWFFFAGDPTKYKAAIVQYNGIITDENGMYLIDNRLEPAIVAYLEHKLIKQERMRDRSSVPYQEVSESMVHYKQMKKQVYADLKGPSHAELTAEMYRFRRRPRFTFPYKDHNTE